MGRTAAPTIAPTTLIAKVKVIARELGLEATLPLIPQVLEQANGYLGINPTTGTSMVVQADAILAMIGLP